MARTFRPSLALRIPAGAAGVVCGVAAGWELWLAVSVGPRHLAAAAVLASSCVFSAAVLRRRVVVRDDGLESANLMKVRRIRWSTVSRIDRYRRSFVVETELGPVSAGWLAEREALLRAVVEHANLVRVYQRLPWGITERYVPSTEPIGFVPHHLRRRDGGPPEETAV